LTTRLKAFVLHLSSEELTDVAWIEAIGALLVGKPPRSWSDADSAKFEVTLTELARNFLHREAIAFEISRSRDPFWLRRSVSNRYPDLHSRELEASISVPGSDTAHLAQVVMELEARLEALGMADYPKLSWRLWRWYLRDCLQVCRERKPIFK